MEQEKTKIRQTATFYSTEKLNEWLRNNYKLEIIDIDYQFAPATYESFFVQYYIEIPSDKPVYKEF